MTTETRQWRVQFIDVVSKKEDAAFIDAPNEGAARVFFCAAFPTKAINSITRSQVAPCAQYERKAVSAHAPGPLEVGYYSTTDEFRAIGQHAAVMRPDRSLVAVTGPSTGKGAMEALDYAQLFATSPDLLAELERLTTWLEQRFPAERRQSKAMDALLGDARAVIAKARAR